MSPGLTTERVYSVLKAQILAGRRPAGERLDPARLAAELHASATPVRDALHQLLGERLVQAQPQLGFQVPIYGEAALRDLYRWNEVLAATALRDRARASAGPSVQFAGNDTDADRVAALFDVIAEQYPNDELRRAVRQASDRLHRARLAEAQACPDNHADIERLNALWSAGLISELRTAIRRYHGVRVKRVAEIAARANAGQH